MLVPLLLARALVPSLGYAQDPQSSVFTISAGPSFFRLPELGHGTGLAIAGTLDRILAGPLGWQINLTAWTATSHVQAGTIEGTEIHSVYFPEIGLSLRARGTVVQPFVGAGLGATLSFGRVDSGGSLYAEGGAQWRVANRLIIRTEVRLRSIRPFAGRTWEATLGLSRGW